MMSDTDTIEVGHDPLSADEPKAPGPPEPYLPSPDEIAAACLKIQTEWSDSERQNRRCGVMVDWRRDARMA